MSIDRKKYDEYFQRWLSTIGTSNALIQCEVENVDRPGTPLRAHIVFSNPNQVVSKGTTDYVPLSNIFDRYFQSYDTLRSEDVVISRGIEDTESVKIITHGAKVTPKFVCGNGENQLFSLRCEQMVGKDTMFFQRVVHIDSVTLGSDVMKAIYPDLVMLNRIRESSVSVKKRK
jgi:hypothetical protein